MTTCEKLALRLLCAILERIILSHRRGINPIPETLKEHALLNDAYKEMK